MAFHTTQEGYRAEVTTFSDIQTGYARWKTEAENRSNAANDYFIANQASLTQ